MSKTSIMDGVKWLYGENFKDKRFNLTVDRVEAGAEFIDGNGRKSLGFAVYFKETPKALGVTGVTVRRQLVMACGGEDYTKWPGKVVTLYGVPSKKAATGWAIRVAEAQQSAAQS